MDQSNMTMRQQAGLWNISDVARMCGMRSQNFYTYIQRGDFFPPTTTWTKDPYHDVKEQRRYYTTKEAKEIVARIELLRDLRMRAKAIRTLPRAT